MRKLKMILLSVVVVFFLTACGTQQGSGAHTQTWPEEEQKEIATTTATTRSQTDQKELDAFWNDAEEWDDYLTEADNNPLYSEFYDLEEKKREAARNKDATKTFSYLNVELDKCKELIESLHKMYVPEIAKSYHDYEINAFIKHKQWAEYAINTWDSVDYDSANGQQIIDERDLLLAKRDQEGQRVKRDLERRAESLGIE